MSEYIGEYVVSLTAKTFTDLRSHRHEQIVRCRDCTNKQPYDEPMGCDCLCGLLWIEVEPDGFCKWGERRKP